MWMNSLKKKENELKEIFKEKFEKEVEDALLIRKTEFEKEQEKLRAKETELNLYSASLKQDLLIKQKELESKENTIKELRGKVETLESNSLKIKEIEKEKLLLQKTVNDLKFTIEEKDKQITEIKK